MLGSVLLAIFTFAFIEGGRAGWISVPVFAASACCVIAFVAFVFVENHSQSPMLPLGFSRVPDFTAASAVAALILRSLRAMRRRRFLFSASYFHSRSSSSTRNPTSRLLTVSTFNRS